MTLSVLGTQLFTADSNSTGIELTGVSVPSGTKSAILVSTIYDSSSFDGTLNVTPGFGTRYLYNGTTEHMFIKSREQYWALTDGHLCILYLNEATLDNDSNGSFYVVPSATVTDQMAVLIFLDGEVEEDRIAIPKQGSDPTSPNISWITIATDTIAVAAALTDQATGSKISLDADESLYIEDVGQDTVLAAYAIRTSSEQQTLSWTDSDGDEDWCSLGVSYKEAGPSPITINLDAATVTANGKATTVVPSAVTTSLNTAAITSSGKIISVVPSAASVELDAGALISSGQVISVVPGAAIVQLDTASLVAAGPSISILLAQSVDLAAAAITANGKATTVVPSAASIQLDTAAITANGKAITIDIPAPTYDFFPISDISAGSWTTTPLWSKIDDKSDSDYIETSSSWDEADLEIDDMQDVTSGTVTIFVRAKFSGGSALFSIELRDSGGSISGSHQPTLTTDWVEYSYDLTSEERDSISDWTDLYFRLATGPMSGTALVSSAYLTIPSTGITVNLDAASITASGKALSVVPGTASVQLDAASIASSGKALSVVPGPASVELDAGALTAFGPSVSIVIGVGPVSINLDAASISASGKALSVVPGAASVNLDLASVSAAGLQLGIVPGAAVVQLGLGLVSVAGLGLSVVPGAAIVSLSAASLVAAGQSISISLGLAVELGLASISASGKSISVVPSAATVDLSVAALTSSGKSISVVPGAASISLDAAALSSSGKSISVVPGAASVSLAAAAITATGPAVLIAPHIEISLAAASIVATGQTIWIYTHPRILPGIEVYGARFFVVDASGNGDYTTIQAAIDKAQTQTPATDSRWLIRIQAGQYQESLTLYDYIDLTGYGYGYSTSLISPAAAAAIDNGAECTISNLNISGENDPVIRTGSGFSGVMRFVNCVSNNDYDEVILFQLVSGTVEIHGCHFISQGNIFYATTGTLKTFQSVFTFDGIEVEELIVIAGAATIEGILCSFINTDSGACVKLTTGSPTSVIFHSCLFRITWSTYSIRTVAGAPAIYLGNCVANAPVSPSITGTHDIEVDANY